MIVLWRIVLVSLALFVGWRVLSLGLGAHFAEAVGDNSSMPETALAWDPNQREALTRLATEKQDISVEDAGEIWESLLRAEAANGTALFGLADTTQNDTQADLLIATATALNSANPTLLKRAAGHWIKRGDLEKAMTAWSTAMIANPRERAGIYQILQKLFEDPRTRGLLAPYLRPYSERPPNWWSGFFRRVAASTADTETVRSLYAMRRSPTAIPLGAEEREAYIERLRKDGLSTEAYLTWINGLDDIHRQALGLVNNGSFEAEPTETGWDWRFRTNPHLVIETASTYGTDGNRALHIAFRQFDDAFSHVSQELFLEPGAYRLTGNVRSNGLKTTGGLQWVIDCVAGKGNSSRIATSGRFLGSSQWEPFALTFDIPVDCKRPVLRLTSAIRVSSDRRLDGSIWFDGIRINRIVAQPSDDG